VSGRRLVAVGRVVLGLLVVAAVVWALAGSWQEVRVDLARVSLGALAGSCALALLALVLTLVGWRAMLADLGSPLALGPASGVLFVGQLGKYLPGSVWTVVVQAEVASRLGVPRKRTAVVGLLSVLLSALAGLAVGVLALPALLQAGGGRVYLLLVLVLLAGLACLHPRLLNALVGRALRLARREPLEHGLSGRAITVTMTAFVLAWLALGLHVWVLVTDLGASAGAAVVPAVLGYALAASVAMLAVLLPAGIGLRELLLVVLLGGVLDRPAATAVVLLSRFLVTGSDVVAALVGWGYARSHHLLAARREAAAAGSSRVEK
jgi:glycosyltransferase 2 family protein